MFSVRHNSAPSLTNAVVRITAGGSVRYSLNGFDVSEFDDGEFYAVPEHVARGMIERGWAEMARATDVPEQGHPKNPTNPTHPGHTPEHPAPAREPDEERTVEGGEDEDQGEGHTRKSKGKRRES